MASGSNITLLVSQLRERSLVTSPMFPPSRSHPWSSSGPKTSASWEATQAISSLLEKKEQKAKEKKGRRKIEAGRNVENREEARVKNNRGDEKKKKKEEDSRA